MYSLTIHFGPNAMVWSFLFKEKKDAMQVYNSLSDLDRDASIKFADDFGQSASVDGSTIHGVMLEDLDLVEEARILRSLANARGEVKARQRASTDPTIRQGMAGNGPGVLTPFRQ